MSCPSCGQRRGRRDCPALGLTICTVCCGTKRLVEIDCPSTCAYLSAARAHPAAIVKRQQEDDVAAVLPSIRHLTERQDQLFFLFLTAIARHVPEGLAQLLDSDVAAAAGAAAATLETAARGVIYEYAATTVPAQRLAVVLRELLAAMRTHGATVYDREAAVVLRAIEQGAGEPRSGPRAYLELMGRLLQVSRAARRPGSKGGRPASSIIVP